MTPQTITGNTFTDTCKWWRAYVTHRLFWSLPEALPKWHCAFTHRTHMWNCAKGVGCNSAIEGWSRMPEAQGSKPGLQKPQNTQSSAEHGAVPRNTGGLCVLMQKPGRWLGFTSAGIAQFCWLRRQRDSFNYLHWIRFLKKLAPDQVYTHSPVDKNVNRVSARPNPTPPQITHSYAQS